MFCSYFVGNNSICQGMHLYLVMILILITEHLVQLFLILNVREQTKAQLFSLWRKMKAQSHTAVNIPDSPFEVRIPSFRCAILISEHLPCSNVSIFVSQKTWKMQNKSGCYKFRWLYQYLNTSGVLCRRVFVGYPRDVMLDSHWIDETTIQSHILGLDET